MNSRVLALIASLLAGAALGADSSPEGNYSQHPPPRKLPDITLTPFEPPQGDCFNLADKFAHPRELIAPKFLYPFEMRRAGIDGEVVVLVQIDEEGYPRKLAILNSTLEVFSRYAVATLMKSRWWTEQNKKGRMGVWFYYKAIYSLSGAPNQSSDPTPASVTPAAVQLSRQP